MTWNLYLSDPFTEIGSSSSIVFLEISWNLLSTEAIHKRDVKWAMRVDPGFTAWNPKSSTRVVWISLLIMHRRLIKSFQENDMIYWNLERRSLPLRIRKVRKYQIPRLTSCVAPKLVYILNQIDKIFFKRFPIVSFIELLIFAAMM